LTAINHIIHKHRVVPNLIQEQIMFGCYRFSVFI